MNRYLRILGMHTTPVIIVACVFGGCNARSKVPSIQSPAQTPTTSSPNTSNIVGPMLPPPPPPNPFESVLPPIVPPQPVISTEAKPTPRHWRGEACLLDINHDGVNDITLVASVTQSRGYNSQVVTIDGRNGAVIRQINPISTVLDLVCTQNTLVMRNSSQLAAYDSQSGRNLWTTALPTVVSETRVYNQCISVRNVLSPESQIDIDLQTGARTTCAGSFTVHRYAAYGVTSTGSTTATIGDLEIQARSTGAYGFGSGLNLYATNKTTRAEVWSLPITMGAIDPFANSGGLVALLNDREIAVVGLDTRLQSQITFGRYTLNGNSAPTSVYVVSRASYRRPFMFVEVSGNMLLIGTHRRIGAFDLNTSFEVWHYDS